MVRILTVSRHDKINYFILNSDVIRYGIVEINLNDIFVATGNGRSKKEAKHNTALAMLSMMGVVSQGASSMDRQEQDAVVPDGSSTIDDSDLGGSNPVGLLQELCMKVKHPPPTYEVKIPILLVFIHVEFNY